MKTISISSINIEYGNRNRHKIKEKSDLIAKYEPDIIFLQECDNHLINFSKNYNYVDYSTFNDEMIEIYSKKSSNWKINSIYQFESLLSYTKRPCKCIELINDDKLIKLGNIHLCGGRYDENDNIGKMLIGNLKEIRSRKNEVIKRLIDEFKVDIIAGDFNSDLNCYLNSQLNEDHLSYFKKVAPKKNILTYLEWNVSPYRLLNDNFYKLAYNKDSNYKYTSVYKTHPDSVWYRSSLLNQKEYNYIDLISKDYSDHNGIYVKFNLN